MQRIYSGAPWESKVGYCRAIKAGKHIYITGTAAVDDKGETVAPGNAYEQARRCLEIIDKALKELGATLAHVVRTRLFVTDISRWEEYGQAHQEAFKDYRPATTMVEVNSLINPDMLIEVEADAYLD